MSSDKWNSTVLITIFERGCGEWKGNGRRVGKRGKTQTERSGGGRQGKKKVQLWGNRV